jgi:hypothetical protein
VAPSATAAACAAWAWAWATSRAASRAASSKRCAAREGGHQPPRHHAPDEAASVSRGLAPLRSRAAWAARRMSYSSRTQGLAAAWIALRLRLQRRLGLVLVVLWGRWQGWRSTSSAAWGVEASAAARKEGLRKGVHRGHGGNAARALEKAPSK